MYSREDLYVFRLTDTLTSTAVFRVHPGGISGVCMISIVSYRDAKAFERLPFCIIHLDYRLCVTRCVQCMSTLGSSCARQIGAAGTNEHTDICAIHTPRRTRCPQTKTDEREWRKNVFGSGTAAE